MKPTLLSRTMALAALGIMSATIGYSQAPASLFFEKFWPWIYRDQTQIGKQETLSRIICENPCSSVAN